MILKKKWRKRDVLQGAGADLFQKAEEGFKSKMFLKLISYNAYPNLIKKHRFG